MRSEELSMAVILTANECISRIMGDGHAQYAMGDSQKFEHMPLPDLLQGLREELQDVVNYAVMLDIRVRRMEAALGESMQACIDEYTKDADA